MDKLTSGMRELMAKNKDIEVEEDNSFKPKSKVVKLRFTSKQYQDFRDACMVFDMISKEPEFSDLVKKALCCTNIKPSSIARQLVNPIVDAPMRIPIKIPRAKKESETRKESYFTTPIGATDKCKELYSEVADEVSLRYDIRESDVTCVTDIRVMLSKYISGNDLKGEYGIVVNNFLYRLAPDAINGYKDMLLRVNDKYVIPKGDRKVMTGIINSIAFGSF